MLAAGYESESDDDGFVFGDEIENKCRNVTTEPPVQIVSAKKTTPSGGFGLPSGYKVYAPNGEMPGVQNTSQHTIEQYKDTVIRGNLDQIEKMIESGMPVDTELRCGWTALMYAANMANPEKLEFLIGAGANVNHHKDQYTVLMTACACNKDRPADIYSCVDTLLKNGADVNTFDRYHSSPLMNAAREGHDLVVSRLIEEGADINKQNNRGWTALSGAVSKGHTKVTQILLDAGADKEKVHTDGQKAVDVANYLGHNEIAELLGHSDTGGAAGGPTPAFTDGDASTSTDVLTPAQSFQTYGELELFLSGLGLNQLISMFHAHKITFEMLLLMTDNDLISMKVNEVGNRKRILDGIHAVHKKEWETTSLPQIQYSKTLTHEEVLAMVANMSKHLKYITSTVYYINSQTRQRPAILEQSSDGLGPKLLGEKTVETLEQIQSLETEMTALSKKCQVVIKKGHFKSPDLIEPIKQQKVSPYLCLKYSGAAVVVGVIVYWRSPITGSLIKWCGALQEWFSVDL